MNPHDRETAPSWYEASRRYQISAPQLKGDARADVVVIGGGLSACSTALHLAEKGVDVATLESRHFGWGASGRSGGQIIVGYSAAMQKIEQLVGMECARELWQHSLAAVAWAKARVKQHNIQCDLTPGYLHAATKPRHQRGLNAWLEFLAKRYNFTDMEYLERAQLREILASEQYCGAVSESASGHLHPLNYCLGIAQAAQQAGARLYQKSAVTQVTPSGGGLKVTTAHGSVTCDKVVYACNAYLHRLQPRLAKTIMPVGTCIIATEPLGVARANALIKNRAAVADENLVLDYYRLSADHRMLFGGRVSYLALEPKRLLRTLKLRMLRVFPQLRDAKIDYAWGGYVAITRNRTPHIGQLDSRTWFAQGFSGHGMALSGYAGGLLADAVLGEDARLACFRQLPHKHFPGGALLRTPSLVAVMSARRLVDALPW